MDAQKGTVTFVTVPEFAALTGIDKKNLYKLIQKNEIPHYRIGRSVRLKLDDFRQEVAHETD